VAPGRRCEDGWIVSRGKVRMAKQRENGWHGVMEWREVILDFVFA